MALGTRILVTGCPGSGKTTLALELGRLTGLPVVHLDALYWREGWQNAPKEEFVRGIQEALSLPAFIMDGNYRGTLDMRLACSDTVVYLDFGRLSCLSGVFRRVARNYGRTRPDMGKDCPERIDWAFLKYVWNFSAEQREGNLDLIASHPGVTPVILKNRREVKRLIASFAAEASTPGSAKGTSI